MTGAIIGTGFFAQFHAEAWTRINDASIVAAVDANLERALEFARRWDIPAAYGSADEMIERVRPDFVDIVTRPDMHLPLTIGRLLGASMSFARSRWLPPCRIVRRWWDAARQRASDLSFMKTGDGSRGIARSDA